MAKKKVKNKKPSQRWKAYKISGDKIEKSRFCPKCGSGIILAKHKDRLYCGGCHYTEFLKK
ncbi:30S ribosomal protein S27ae [Candidatus Woesearchaeota archaeon]|nr:30S ribosomal protein S27ae [Candidatus Woesearchaeota archaeon]